MPLLWTPQCFAMWRVFLFTNILIAPSTCATYKVKFSYATASLNVMQVRTADGKERIVKAREESKVFPDLELPAAKITSDYSDYGEIKCAKNLSGPCAESARSVTGRQCPHIWSGGRP